MAENNCAGCHGEAARKGLKVKMTDVYPYELCPVCEARVRSGLIHYRPSNGTEFRIFYVNCFDCRHFIDDLENPKPGKLTAPFTACTWGVLDRLHVQMVEAHDHISNWFDPADVATRDADGSFICPAECKRFTGKDDHGGELRDPPPRDCEGQMFLGELLTVAEKVPASPARQEAGK